MHANGFKNYFLNIITSDRFHLLYLPIASLGSASWLLHRISSNQYPNMVPDGNSVCWEKQNCRDPSESRFIPLGQESVLIDWRFPKGIYHFLSVCILSRVTVCIQDIFKYIILLLFTDRYISNYIRILPKLCSTFAFYRYMCPEMPLKPQSKQSMCAFK